MLDNYSCVRLLTDKYKSEDAPKGDIGTIIELYGGGACEIEFSGPDGTTYAMIVAHEEELELIEPVPTEPGP